MVELPPGGVLATAGARPARLSLRRYATEEFPVTVGAVPARRSAELRIPTDRSTEPWELAIRCRHCDDALRPSQRSGAMSVPADRRRAQRASGGAVTKTRMALAGLALAAVAGALAVIAYKASFSVINLVDDDGYVIVSLRLFDQGGALYSDVYSQYGPGLFTFLGGALHLLGIDLMSDGSHWINLGFWIGSTLLAGLAVLRLTGSFPVALAGLLVTFLVLQADAYEPLHPGAMIGFCLIAIVAVAAFVYEPKPKPAMALLGALAMTVASVKINVGGFAFASILFAWAVTTPLSARWAWVRIAASAAFVVLPFALLTGRLDDTNTLRFAAIVAAAGAALAVIALARPPAGDGASGRLAWLGIGAGAVALLVCAVPLATGTSPGDLIDGWVVQPSHTPGLQFGFLRLDALGLIWATVGLEAAVVCAYGIANGAAVRDPRWRLAVGAGRVLLGVAILVSLADGRVFDPFDDLTRPFVVAGPFAWVAVLAPPSSRLQAGFIRMLVVALAVLQPLHAFPVPGTQLAWGQVLFVVVACLCLADGAGELASSELVDRSRRALANVLAAAGVLGLVGWVALGPLQSYGDLASGAYGSRVPLDLPGASRVRGSPDQVANLHALVDGLRERCETFLTLPGLNSLYLYTGEPPPAALNGPWTYFFDDHDQRAVVERVRNIDRLCVVENRRLQHFWAGFSGKVEPRPLVDYIDRNFEPTSDFDGYLLLERKSRGG